MDSILFVQFGDYREAYFRLASGEAETYRDQKKSVDFVGELAQKWRVTTVSLGVREYWEEISPGLWAGGVIRVNPGKDEIQKIFDRAAPTHVVLRTPNIGILSEAIRRHCYVLPAFADIFYRGGFRNRWSNYRLRRMLSKPSIPCVANHNLNASCSIASALGVPSTKIVPWDWSRVPISKIVKKGIAEPSAPRLLYAGVLSESKGVGDLLRAVWECRNRGLLASLTLVGPGNSDEWLKMAKSLQISELVYFCGQVSNKEVREKMLSHDIVVVPSRHNYPEGLPNTIYEGLASRTPLVISDHPSFVGRLKDGQECIVFKSRDGVGLADGIIRLCKDKFLYSAISQNSYEASNNLYVGQEWPQLINLFLSDPENSTGWVESSSIFSLQV